MVRTDGGGMRARVVGRRSGGDPGAEGAQAEDRRARRAASVGPVADESVSASLGTLAGGSGRAAVTATPAEAGGDADLGEESAARAGDGTRVVPEAEAVEREWAEATGSTGARDVGQPAAARVVDAAGRAESADRRVGPGGGSGSGAAAGSGTAAGPEGRGSGGGPGLRADAGHGRAVPAFAPAGELPGAESARGVQRSSPVSRPYK